MAFGDKIRNVQDVSKIVILLNYKASRILMQISF